MGGLLLCALGLLFIAGKGIVFGVEGSATHLIPVSQNTFAGWALIATGISLSLPRGAVKGIKSKIRGKQQDFMSSVSLIDRIKKEEAYNETKENSSQNQD